MVGGGSIPSEKPFVLVSRMVANGSGEIVVYVKTLGEERLRSPKNRIFCTLGRRAHMQVDRRATLAFWQRPCVGHHASELSGFDHPGRTMPTIETVR